MRIVFFLCAVVTDELSRIFAQSLGATQAQAAIIAALYSFPTARLLSGGMEVVIAVPMLLVSLIAAIRSRELPLRRSLYLGLLASLAILARLDIAILVGLLIVLWLYFSKPGFTQAAKSLLAFCAGGSALRICLVANLICFHSLLPLSAIAKRLQTSSGLSIGYLKGVAIYSVYGPTAAIVLLLGGLALLSRLRKPAVDPRARIVPSAVLVFCAIFFGLNATGGWIFFGWYAYPIAPR